MTPETSNTGGEQVQSRPSGRAADWPTPAADASDRLNYQPPRQQSAYRPVADAGFVGGFDPATGKTQWAMWLTRRMPPGSLALGVGVVASAFTTLFVSFPASIIPAGVGALYYLLIHFTKMSELDHRRRYLEEIARIGWLTANQPMLPWQLMYGEDSPLDPLVDEHDDEPDGDTPHAPRHEIEAPPHNNRQGRRGDGGR